LIAALLTRNRKSRFEKIELSHRRNAMTKSQALKEAVKRWGKNAAVQDKGKERASTPERRAEAKARLRQFNALPEGEKKVRRKERDHWLTETYRYRYTVGFIAHGIAFAVQGDGDTWEEAFASADERKAA
jgi:hypothetical protein